MSADTGARSTAATGRFGTGGRRGVHVLVDAHVHVHAGADVGVLLDAARDAFAAAARDVPARTWRGVLMLAETAGRDWFGETCEAQGAIFDRWRVEPAAGDTAALHAVRGDGSWTLTIFAGRQAVTAEGIEVLALAARAALPDGEPLGATLRRAAAAGGLTVLPWGAGKWLGARGRRVERALAAQAPPVFAGDNGGRPRIWPEPRAFAVARRHGRGLVSGSDPLPLPGEERRVGGFGFRITLRTASAEAPFVERLALVAAVERSKPEALVPYGRREGSAGFLRRQLALRLAPRGRRTPRHAASAVTHP